MTRHAVWLGTALPAFALAICLGGFAGAAEGKASGRVSVELRNVRVEKTAVAFRFLHDRAFIESGGVGVTLTQGQVCFTSGVCNGQPVNYRIEANQSFVRENAVIEPLGPEETFAYTYSGQDDNGHVVYVIFRIVVNGDQYEVTP